MTREKLLKVKEFSELLIWLLIFTAVILLNLSPHLIRIERIHFIAIFSSLLLIFVFDRLISRRIVRWKRNIIRAFVYLACILIIYYILRFPKYSVWFFYFSPLFLAFSLSLTFITQPRVFTVLLVAVSVFLLGDLYWESHVSYDTARVVMPIVLAKVLALSLLSVFGYYLYRNQIAATKQAEIYSQNLKILNQQLSAKTDELEKTNKRLKELSEAKSVFVATVSHELRTPLTAILNSLKLIEYETRDSKAVNEYMDIIKKNIERQAIMIDNLLDTARIERGSLQGSRTKFELNYLLQEVVDALSNQASEKNIGISLHPMKEDSSLWGEHEQLRRVFINLVDNAIKFTPASGKIEISLAPEESNIKVAVADNGCGIPKEEQERIFEAFVQVSQQEPQGSKKGIGLGLTIVREIVHRHRGKVRVESEVNKGSRFYVLLPVDLRKSNR